MSTLEQILKEYPYYVSYENVYPEAKSWIRYPCLKYHDYLLCKNIDDVLICMVQAYLSCIYFEKNIENDLNPLNTLEELIEKYGILPDISEKMKQGLISDLNDFAKYLIDNSKKQWNDENYTETERKNSLVGRKSCVSSSFEFDIQNGAKIKYNVGMSAFHQRYMEYTQNKNCSDFQPIGYYGYHMSNYIYFYSIEKINENINIFRFRNYQEDVNHENICDFIDTKFLNRLKLSELSKTWISESRKIMDDCKSSAICLDQTNGFLIDEADFEDFSSSSFIYSKIYVLNRRKYYSSYTSITSYNHEKAIEYIKETKKINVKWFVFKQTLFYDILIPEMRSGIKSYLFG